MHTLQFSRWGPTIPAQLLDFHNLPDNPVTLFRFEVDELFDITVKLGMPAVFHTSEGDSYPCAEGLAIVCRRLAYPARWNDLVAVFGRSSSGLSRIFRDMMHWLDSTWGHLLDFDPLLFQHRLPEWAAAVLTRGAPIPNVVVFIDGTLQQICRPNPARTLLLQHLPGITADALQRSVYSGHKRHHGMKFHGVTAPNGLFWIHGPNDGRRHDLTLFQRANMFFLVTLLTFATVPYLMYGDSAYPNLPNMASPIPSVLSPPGSRNAMINTLMSSVRTVGSEWTFGIISNTWQTTNFPRWQRAFLTLPGMQFRVASLLTNIRTCVNDGNTITEWFREKDVHLHVPDLRSYVNG
jgi:hypothetical protein